MRWGCRGRRCPAGAHTWRSALAPKALRSDSAEKIGSGPAPQNSLRARRPLRSTTCGESDTNALRAPAPSRFFQPPRKIAPPGHRLPRGHNVRARRGFATIVNRYRGRTRMGLAVCAKSRGRKRAVSARRRTFVQAASPVLVRHHRPSAQGMSLFGSGSPTGRGPTVPSRAFNDCAWPVRMAAYKVVLESTFFT
jgi:hypothetical protein